MQNPLANFIGVFSLVRDVRGFQVNPLCRHDITSPFPPSGNRGYVHNLDVTLTVSLYFLNTDFTSVVFGEMLNKNSVGRKQFDCMFL